MDSAHKMPASDVSEMLLEKTRVALLGGDFDMFASCFILPHVFGSAHAEREVTTYGELNEVFDSIREDMASKGITDLIRVCEVAEYRSPSLIHATHVTHLMNGSQRLRPPYPCFSVLELRDGIWKVRNSTYDVDKLTMIGRAFKASHQKTSNIETKVRNEL